MKRFVVVSVSLIVLAVAARADEHEFPEYSDQDSANTGRRSGICTFDGEVIWDDDFLDLVSDAFSETGVEEFAAAFLQCYGGGMIDELTQMATVNALQASYTSAAAWNGPSNWDDDDPASNRNESLYNIHYSPWVGGATVRTHYAASENGHDNDIDGPVQATPYYEVPQFWASGVLPDRTGIRLHNPNLNGETPDKYMAVLWGGSADSSDSSGARWANYYSLDRIYGDLKDRGYDDDEIYMMYPYATKPNGTALPADWNVDDGTNLQDMSDAFTWLGNNMTATTQVYFWSNICHGDNLDDLLWTVWDNTGSQIEADVPYSYDLWAGKTDLMRELFTFYGGPAGGAAGQPLFEVTVADDPLVDLSVILNGHALTHLETTDVSLLGETRYCYKFALSELDMLNLADTGNVVVFDWTTADVEFVRGGLTMGGHTNGIPEPATVSLLVAGCFALLRRRRKA